MFEKLMSDATAIARHRTQPLAKEREDFLNYLQVCGTGRESIQTAACYLLQIVSLLRLHHLRDVTPDEVNRAAERWSKRRTLHHNVQPGPYSKDSFAWVARRWLRFAGRLRLPHVHQPFRKYLDDYLEAMKSEKGLSDATIRGRRFRAVAFLRWFGKRHRQFCKVSAADADAYLFREGTNRCPITCRSEAGALRAFFRHAEDRGWCRPGIATAIKAPLIRQSLFEAQGPKWKDVLQLLRANSGRNRSNIRAHALLLLFAIYGLRNSEAIRLRLKDIDWENKTLTIWRAKRGGFQQFPLHDAIGKAIRRYIDRVRPKCSCPNVFVTINGPYRPLEQTSVSTLVHDRMLKLGIDSRRKGPQALRHACATRLLEMGASFTEISDFLGHRDGRAVQVYAKLDIRRLREVSALDLAGAL